MTLADSRYLVTGAMGCVSAWTLYHLAQQGQQAVAFDLSEDRRRLDLLLTPEEQARITFVRGDLTDPVQVLKVIQDNDVTHIVHLAALQVPFCRADPVLGARVNVVGTVNVFEAARQAGIRRLAYASSVAVYGPPAPGQETAVMVDADLRPATLYGVYKMANEGTARVYWQDHGISSIALRPYTIYGVGRDQGITSGPTQAMLAAVEGKPFHIPFNGPCQYHYASDVARFFLLAAEQPLEGAHAFNLGSSPATTHEIINLIQAEVPGAQVTCSEAYLPFPAGFDDAPLRQAVRGVAYTPLEVGIRETIHRFRALAQGGKIR